MKLQSLLLGSLLIVAGGLAACSPGNSVSVPTCTTPGCVITPVPAPPGGGGTTAPLPGATAVAVAAGTTTVALPGAPAGSNAQVALTGSSGGTLYVLPYSNTAPAGFTLPAGATFYGTSAVQNNTATPFTATSATFSATLVPTPAAGSTCYLSAQTNGSGQFFAVPGTLNGAAFTATANNVVLPANTYYTYVVYCVPPGTVTPTPSPSPLPNASPTTIPANTPITITAGQAPFNLPTGGSINFGPTSGGTIYVVPFSTATPAPAILPAGGTPAGTYLGQLTVQNTSSTGISSQNGGTITLPTTVANGGTCTLYYSTNGGAGQKGVTGTSNGSSVTFTIPGGQGIAPGYYDTAYAYCVAPAATPTPTPTPAPALSSPTAIPAPVTGAYGSNDYQYPNVNATGAPSGTSVSGNNYLSSPAPGTTVAVAITAGTPSATGVATPSPAVVNSLGLPVYDGTTNTASSAYGGTPIYYGSFVFANPSNTTVTANPGGTASSNLFITLPGLNTYAAANPGVNYYLAPIDTTVGKYATSNQTSPFTGSTVTFPIQAQQGTGVNGTPTGTVNQNGQVNFVTNAQSGFIPGVTYGYVIIAK